MLTWRSVLYSITRRPLADSDKRTKQSRLEHPVSSSQQPDPQTQTPSTDTSSEPSGGGGPERASHLSDIQATEQHVRFAAQAELHRQAAAAELRGKKGATGRPGSGSMGSASPPFQRTATEPSPRPNGRDPYWQHMRSDVQRQRELEQMAAARTQTQQTHRQMPLFPPYQAAFPGAQKAPMHEPLLQPQMPRARRSSTSSPDYFSFIRQQQGRPVPPAATPPLSGHSDYSDSDFEEGLYR